MTLSIITRFAPSPTGRLHLGHAYAALFVWDRARRADGTFLLRMEDIDPQRCRPEFVAGILDDLAWLGVDWDGPVHVQSAHMAKYRAVLDALAARGLTYPCFCSRADIARAVTAPHGPDGTVYPGTCRALDSAERAGRVAAGQVPATRLDMAAALATTGPLTIQDEDGTRVHCDAAAFGDVVLGRRDAPASYHLCATHDDAVQGVTLVTRGVDLAPATAAQRVLQALMGWPEPRYRHHRLLLDPVGRRLAKRDAAATLAAMRDAGATPASVRALCRDARG